MEDDGLHAEGIASCSAGVTWGYRRRSFVGELPRWGGGAVMDLPVAPAVVGGFGGNVFPAASVGMMAGTPAAAGLSGATFQAASSAMRPPSTIAFASDDHEDYQVRRMLVDSCSCAVILASVFTVLAFRYCVTHVGSAGRPHSLYSRSLLFSSGPFLLVLSYFLLVPYYIWTEPLMIILLSKIMRGGL